LYVENKNKNHQRIVLRFSDTTSFIAKDRFDSAQSPHLFQPILSSL